MISRAEMIKLLAEEYNIHNDKELDEALDRVAVNLAPFIIPLEVHNEERNVQSVS